jgi:type I restriction enzyme R subunit
VPGEDLERTHEEVVLRDRLKASLRRRYTYLTQAALNEAVARFARPVGVDTLRRNMAFHHDLTRGIEVRLELLGDRVEHLHLFAVDWEHPDANEFLIVNRAAPRRREGCRAGGCPARASHTRGERRAL